MEDLSRHLEQQHAGSRSRPRSEPGRPVASAPPHEERGVSHAAGEAAWDWDIRRGTIARGGAVVQLTGFTSDEIPDDPAWWRDRIHPQDRASVLAAFDAALVGERRELILLYRFLRKDGRYVLLLDRAFVLAPGGTVERIVGFVRELSAPPSFEPSPGAVAEKGAGERPGAESEDEGALEYRISSLERERLRVSRELHDEIGQLLTALRILLRSRSFSRASAEELIDELFTRVRDISEGLRPPMLDDLGLGPSLNWHFGRFTARTGVRINLMMSGRLHRYPSPVELAIFRVVQEALTNVARHAGSAEAWVSLQGASGRVTGIITDHGHGFDPKAPPVSTSSGIAGMRGRLMALGGRLMITSQPGQGTRVFFRIPTDEEEASSPHEVPR
jgi:signal transduction histidine kinase